MRPTEAIVAHYAPGELASAILEALRAAGKNPDALTLDDLAPLDEFHTRGRKATRELAARAGLGAGDHVLDIGCGVGGPARFLAAQHGCHVTGVDLAPEYCRLATLLSERTGLAEHVCFGVADATALPFHDCSFDVAWMQHCSMNISNKQRLFAETRRVLRPRGRLALYEVVAGPGGEVVLPVPWARDPSISFLLPADRLRRVIEAAGLRGREWEDASREALDWFRAMVARTRTAEPSPIGLHLLLGPEMRLMSANMVRNLEDERIAIVRAIFERDSAEMEPSG